MTTVAASGLCIHSTGHKEGEEPDRYAGILCMLSCKCFAEPRVKEHVQGRLLQVTATHHRSQMPVCIVGLYQHVWRPHLSAAQNRSLRTHIWHSLQALITATPARHQLVIAGDFNATLTPMHPQVGPSVPRPATHANQDKELQTLLKECDLCAVNTWHSRPHHTFTSPSVKSQLDYVLLRTHSANHHAKHASPIHSFPVGAYRQTNHHPVQAVVQMLPMAYRASQPQAEFRFEAAALQSAVSQHSDAAQALQQAVETRLSALPPGAALCTEHDTVNTILLEETCRAFPPAQRADHRVSANQGYRASARGTWQLHHQLRRSGLPSLRNLWARWRLYAQFMRASAMLRRQSKDLKRQFLEDQLRQAEAAARKGNHRDLFLIARRLGPKTAQGVSRLQGSDGRVLDSSAEMAAILKHSQATLAATPDKTDLQPLQAGFTFSAEELQAALDALNIRKAVPRHIAPNAVWKLCAASVGAHLGPCFEHHFRPKSTDLLEGDLQDAHICWLNKPSKPPTTMSAKRPIGLMPPCAKSLAGSVASQILEHLQPMLDHMPQFAYCAGRGVNDAILRVHSYFGEIETLQRGQINNRFKMHQGVKALHCHGGLCLSLDLSSAFDSVSRDLLIQSLLDHQVPSDLINVVQQLHRGAKYIFRTSQARGQVTTTNGIKQGCRAAPTLWVSFTLSVLEHLARHRSLSWVQNILTLFADDFCGHWTITCLQDWKAAISDLTLLMETLETYQLRVNLQKTALLVNLKGKTAKKLLRQHTRQKAGETFLILQIHGRECLLRLKESHTYLGTIISYRDRRDLNVGHRISAAQTRYQQLRKVLNGRGPLSIKYRLRLWQACIPPCLTYSLEATGCTAAKGLQRIKTIATRHVRAILREPAHLQHVSTSEIWERARLPAPEQSIHARLVKLCACRNPANHPFGPDLINNDNVIKHLNHLLDCLQEALRGLTTYSLTPPEEAQPCHNPGFPCPFCDLVLPTSHARLIHSAIKHPEQQPPEDHRTKTDFSAPDHAVNGLPTCKLCRRNFTKWQHLKTHIEQGSCVALGGDSMKLSPPLEDNPAMSRSLQEPVIVDATARAYAGAETPELAAQNAVPLISDPLFLSTLESWDQHLNNRHMRARLQSRCVVCGMWIADGRHVKQHYNRTHHHDFPHALEHTQKLCLTFKSQFTRGRSCRYCGVKVGAPCRHVIQCTVLHQLCLAVSISKPESSQQAASDGRSRGGHLRTLHALWGSGDGGRTSPQTSQAGPSQAAGASGRSLQLPLPESTPVETDSSLVLCTASTGLPASSDQQAAAEARRAASGPEEGHPVRPLLSTGRQVNPALTHECLARVEGQAGSGGSIHPVVPANGSDQLLAEGTVGPGATSGGDRARQRISEKGGMAHELQRMDLHEVVIQASETGGRRDKGAPGSRRSGEDHHRTPEIDARRDYPQIPEHHKPCKAGGTRSPASHFPLSSIPAWLRSHGSLRSVSQVGRAVADESRRIQHEGGRPTASTDGAAACSADLRGRPAETYLTQSVHASSCQDLIVPIPSSATISTHPTSPSPFPNTHMPRNYPTLPKFSLLNPHNHCYLNATVYCLSLLEQRIHRPLLPSAFNHDDDRLLNALKILGFNLLGWRRPDSQRDVAELIDFLVPRLCPSQMHYSWSARTSQHAHAGGVHHVDGAALSKCLSLSYITLDCPDPQTLINRWHQQEEAHALDSKAPWFFLQLPRSCVGENGEPQKNHNPIVIPKVVHMPIFERPLSLETRWQPYHTVACILHHGPSLISGHYNVLSLGDVVHHVLDDAKPKEPATNAFLESASCNAYILVLVLDDSDASQLRQAQASLDSNVGRQRDESLPAEKVRRHLDSGAPQLDGVSVEGARGPDDADAKARGQYPFPDAYASALGASSCVLVQQSSDQQGQTEQGKDSGCDGLGISG